MKTVLQTEGSALHSGYHHWSLSRPLLALTPLTIWDADVWVVPWFLNSHNEALPKLPLLEISFAYAATSPK